SMLILLEPRSNTISSLGGTFQPWVEMDLVSPESVIYAAIRSLTINKTSQKKNDSERLRWSGNQTATSGRKPSRIAPMFRRRQNQRQKRPLFVASVTKIPNVVRKGDMPPQAA